jgi:hypothetical protein
MSDTLHFAYNRKSRGILGETEQKYMHFNFLGKRKMGRGGFSCKVSLLILKLVIFLNI